VSCWSPASRLDIDIVGRPFLDGVVTVGPRIDARIRVEGGSGLEEWMVEEGRCVPAPGEYEDIGPSGCPGRAIGGRDILDSGKRKEEREKRRLIDRVKTLKRSKVFAQSARE